CISSNLLCIFNLFFFFINPTATPEFYTLSLHDALPIFQSGMGFDFNVAVYAVSLGKAAMACSEGMGSPAYSEECQLPASTAASRSEEHTSELQSRENLVCRLLLEKKKLIN